MRGLLKRIDDARAIDIARQHLAECGLVGAEFHGSGYVAEEDGLLYIHFDTPSDFGRIVLTAESGHVHSCGVYRGARLVSIEVQS